MPAPVAKIVPLERTFHGDTVVDPYAWLRNRDDDPDVLAYLEAENAWTDEQLEPTKELQATLFAEIKARIQESDLSVPVRKGPWRYYTRTEEGQQYSIHCRHPEGDAEDEAVILDQNELAEGHDYFSLGTFDISVDHGLLAYSTDTTGGEVYELAFRDLVSGEDLPDRIPGTYYGSAWSRAGDHFFYTRPDEAMRPYQLWRHELGTDPADDVLIHEEDDERFFVSVGLTRDEAFLYSHVGSKITDEVWLLDSSDPTGDWWVIERRIQGVEYNVEHHRGTLFITTNVDGADNFKLMETTVERPGREHWQELIPHRPAVKLSGVDAFAEHLVIYERADAVTQIRVRDLGTGEDHVIEQPESVSTAHGGNNPEFDSTSFRYTYQSMITPTTIFEYDLATRERTVLKQQPVLGGYDSDHYVTERVWAPAEDGTRIPMSVVYRRGFERDGTAPAFLYGYGSYEASIDPYFSSIRLSLLDRGFVFAIAHVRGGGEMGRPWYTDGKFLAKRNTFTDFIACARHLVSDGWTSPERLAVRGASAGGLLMGAVANLAPDAVGAIIAEVPFVDSLNTILDPSLPLTVLEWEEWGNPIESAEYYQYMKSYAPYENVAAIDYPPMLVTAGLNDPRVSYWEPAKWVAKLRATRTDTNQLLLRTEMGAGHGGPSGRYDAWKDEALVLAFVLTTLAVE